MKKRFPLTAFALPLALVVAISSSQAVPPVETAPVAPNGAPAATETLTDAQRFGRFFKGVARTTGAGLKKTGQAMGRAANKMIEKGGPKTKPAPEPAS